MDASLDPVAVLIAEHRTILLVLGRAEEACELVLRGGPMDRPLFAAAIDFLLNYVDGTHSEKEVALFSALAPDGIASAPAAVRRLIEGHAMAHASALTLRGLAVSLEGGVYSPRKIAEALLRFATHFREHAHLEESAVFPLARRLLSPRAREVVLHQFAEIAARQPPMNDAIEAFAGTPGSLHAH